MPPLQNPQESLRKDNLFLPGGNLTRPKHGGDYLDWVKHRLQPSYALESSGEFRLVFGKHLGGDYESVTIQTTTTKESLHVKVAYVIFPD